MRARGFRKITLQMLIILQVMTRPGGWACDKTAGKGAEMLLLGSVD